MKSPDELMRRWLGEDFSSCALLAEMISQNARTTLATMALEECLIVTSAPNEVHAVVHIGKHPELWSTAHRAFDAVRDLTLRYEQTSHGMHSAYYALLFVAENAARVIYNATSPPDPFDDDSAAWLLMCLAQLVNQTGTPNLRGRLWQLVEEACARSA